MYLVIDHRIPSMTTHGKSDDELEYVEREVGNDAKHPYGCSPCPSNTLDLSKAPACIHSNKGGHQLSCQEGEDKHEARSLKEGPAS